MTTGPGGKGQLTDAAKGFGYSIYFMLTLVFGIMGTIVFFVVRTMITEERKMNEKK